MKRLNEKQRLALRKAIAESLFILSWALRNAKSEDQRKAYQADIDDLKSAESAVFDGPELASVNPYNLSTP